MLSCLRPSPRQSRSTDSRNTLLHLTITSGHDNNRAVHVGRTSNHVLDVIGVAGTVDVRIVPLIRLILNMGRCDRNTSLSFFRCFVDRAVVEEASKAFLCLPFRDCSCKSCLNKVSITIGASGGKSPTFPWSTWPMVPDRSSATFLSTRMKSLLRTNINVRLRPLEDRGVCSCLRSILTKYLTDRVL